MSLKPSTPASFGAHEMPNDVRQHAVRRSCVVALLQAWRRCGGSTQQLLSHQGLEANLEANPQGFLAWPTFAALLRALGEKLNADAFRQAGHEASARRGFLAAGFWMRNLYSVTEAYEQVFGSAYTHLSPLHQSLTCLETQCRIEDDAVFVSLRLKPGYAMTREFFWYLQGVAEGLPRMHGLQPVAALCEWHGLGIDLRLTAPTALPVLARMRRGLVMAFTPKFLSRELHNAHLALQAKAADLEAQLRLLNQLKADEESARLQAEMASEAKNDFLTAMSHDLRTPLNSIAGLAELLADALPEGEQKQDARAIVVSSHEVRRKIDHLLDYAQWAHENSAPDWSEIKVDKILNELADGHAPTCFAKGLNFTLKVGATMPPLCTDARRLKAVLSIFLGNACKHSESGTITLAASFDAHALTLEVSDEGFGIPADKIQDLFREAPADLDSPRLDSTPLGFNLAIAARLAESLKAVVGVTSRQGHGTVFSLRLPWMPASTRADWVPAFPTPSASMPTQPMPIAPATISPTAEASDLGMRILVVEDHALSRDVTERLLRRAGYRVFSASHGLEAAKLCRAQHFDVVLLDIGLPGMDGIAAGRTILKSSEKPPRIVAYTASVSEADQRACQDAGFDGFIAKPASLQTLLATLVGLMQIPRSSTQFTL